MSLYSFFFSRRQDNLEHINLVFNHVLHEWPPFAKCRKQRWDRPVGWEQTEEEKRSSP